MEEVGGVFVEAGLVHRLRDVPSVPPPTVVVRVPRGDQGTRVWGCDDRSIRAGRVAEEEDARSVDVSSQRAQRLGGVRQPPLHPGLPERLGLLDEPRRAAVAHVVTDLVDGGKAPTGRQEQADLDVAVGSRLEVPFHHAVGRAVGDRPTLETPVLGVHVRTLQSLQGVLSADGAGDRRVGEELEEVTPLVVDQGGNRRVDERRILVHRLGDLERVVGEQADRARRVRLAPGTPGPRGRGSGGHGPGPKSSGRGPSKPTREGAPYRRASDGFSKPFPRRSQVNWERGTSKTPSRASRRCWN